jgi:prefoldin alpha subunit
MVKEELLIQLSMLEQQANEQAEKIQAIDNQISELESLKLSLKKMEKSRGREMLSPLGRGIFLKTEIKDEKVFVNVGSRTLVKKTFPEAAEIVDTQVREMENLKHQLMHNIKEINQALAGLLEEAQKEEK